MRSLAETRGGREGCGFMARGVVAAPRCTSSGLGGGSCVSVGREGAAANGGRRRARRERGCPQTRLEPGGAGYSGSEV